MKRKFAAFDIDGTVARNSIFLAVIDELILRGHLPAEAGIQLTKKLEEYRQRKNKEAFNTYVKLSVDILFKDMQKLAVLDYKKAVDQVLKNHKLYSYVYTRDLIKQLKSEGYFLIALSGSEMYSVQQFGEYYGFDVAIGETYVEKDGHFTGEVEQVVSKKDVYIQRLVKEYELTFKGSIAVGDSKSDAKMLEHVEKPIAFNPESRLLEIARGSGWKIVIERKNVIYELEQKNGIYELISE